MKKALAVCLFAALTVFALTACGKEAETTTPSSPSVAEEKIVSESQTPSDSPDAATLTADAFFAEFGELLRADERWRATYEEALAAAEKTADGTRR